MELLIVFPSPENSHFIPLSFILLPQHNCWQTSGLSLVSVTYPISKLCAAHDIFGNHWNRLLHLLTLLLSRSGIVCTSFLPPPDVHKAHAPHAGKQIAGGQLFFSATAVSHFLWYWRDAVSFVWLIDFSKKTLTVQNDSRISHGEIQVGLCCVKKLSGPDYSDHTFFFKNL